MSWMNSELVPLTSTIKIKLAFKLQQFFKKEFEPFFTTPSNLKFEIDHLLVLSGGGGKGSVQLGTPVFTNAKKRPSVVFICSLTPWGR